MRTWMRRSALPLMCVTALVVLPSPVASQEEDQATPTWVDFRMAPMEQAKKINQQLVARKGAGETMTLMRWDGRGDGHHLIINSSRTSPTDLRRNLANQVFDSVSWHGRLNRNRPRGSCDSDAECREKTEEMCKAAGHGGVRRTTVRVIVHADGSKTCSGDCLANGAIAFVTCNPS